MARDTFTSRLGESPDRAMVVYHSVPNFENKMEYLWEPLLLLNRAQTMVLEEVGILETQEALGVHEAIDDLTEVDVETFDSYEDYGGPYFFLEDHVISKLGAEVGGKLHTGRSRNDMYSAALRIAVREATLHIVEATLTLRERLLAKAEETTQVVLPAFTHSQPAQPITFAHYVLGFDHLLSRDVRRLLGAFEETNRSPLGAAAIGGTGFPLDRERLAELSGFSDIVLNTYDAIASVDYVPETASAVGLLATNLSRISQDFLIWSMFEVRFVELTERLSSVSSIMPQKKNPSVLEKSRSLASESIGHANSSLVSLKSVPYGDVGETSYLAFPMLEGASKTTNVIRLFSAVIDDLQLNEDRMYDDAHASFCTMTELADTLVREAGLSFRQAHEVVGTLVHAVYEDGRDAGEITLADLDAAAKKTLDETGLLTQEALMGALDPRENVTRRDILGGTAPEQNLNDIANQRERLVEQQESVSQIRAQLDAAKEARNSRS